FQSLLCGIILEQHPGVRVDGETAKTRKSPLSLHHKLFGETHVPDIVGTSGTSASAPMTRKDVIAALKAYCKDLDEKKL
ncbi:envelope-like protein, partial [Trifolium medium]|nr:envelope-like protein [Trifolium medium]